LSVTHSPCKSVCASEPWDISRISPSVGRDSDAPSTEDSQKACKVSSAVLKLLRSKGVAERCQIVGGNFFESVPAGGDLYMLKAILHDWEDEDAIRILRVCRRAAKPEGKLLVIERVLGPPNEIPDGKFSDLNMLVAPGGQERTRDEFATLLSTAGFTLTRVIPTGTRHSLIEATPA